MPAWDPVGTVWSGPAGRRLSPCLCCLHAGPPPAEQLEFLVLEPNPSLLWPLMSVFLPKGWLYADGKVGTARALRIGSAQRGVE